MTPHPHDPMETHEATYQATYQASYAFDDDDKGYDSGGEMAPVLHIVTEDDAKRALERRRRAYWSGPMVAPRREPSSDSVLRTPVPNSYEDQLRTASRAAWFRTDLLDTEAELALRRALPVQSAPFDDRRDTPRLVHYELDQPWYPPLATWAQMGERWLRSHAQPTGDQVVYVAEHNFSLGGGASAADALACERVGFGTRLEVRFATPGRRVEAAPYVVRVPWVGTLARDHLHALFAARFLTPEGELRGDVCERLYVEGGRLATKARAARGEYAHYASVRRWEDCALANVPHIDTVKIRVQGHAYVERPGTGGADDPLLPPDAHYSQTWAEYSLPWLVEHASGTSQDLQRLLAEEGLDARNAVDTPRGIYDERERSISFLPRRNGRPRHPVDPTEALYYDPTPHRWDGEGPGSTCLLAATLTKRREATYPEPEDRGYDNDDDRAEYDYDDDYDDDYEARGGVEQKGLNEYQLHCQAVWAEEARQMYRDVTEEEWHAKHWDTVRNTLVRCDGTTRNNWPGKRLWDELVKERVHALFVQASVHRTVDAPINPIDGCYDYEKGRQVSDGCPDIHLLHELVCRACYEEIRVRLARHKEKFSAS